MLRMRLRVKFFALAGVLTLALHAASVGAVSVGNGGSSPVGEYHTSLPTLTNGQTSRLQVDSLGRLIVVPFVPATWLPVYAPAPLSVQPAGSPFPVSAATTFPVSGTLNVGNFPGSQGVFPAASAMPFPVSASTTFPVSGSVGITNLPSVTYIAPVPSSSPLSVNCITGCSGSGGGTLNGIYNSTLPTYTTGATVTPQYDANGRAIVAPFTISLQSPLPISAQYNAGQISLTSGQFAPPQVDQNGYLMLSPLSGSQVAAGLYSTDQTPVLDGQSTQLRVNSAREVIVAASTPLPVTVAQVGTLVNRSNVISGGATPQPLLPYERERRGYLIQNTSSADLWINIMGSLAKAGSPSFKISTFSSFTTPPFFPASAPVSIWGGTTGQTFSVVTW